MVHFVERLSMGGVPLHIQKSADHEPSVTDPLHSPLSESSSTVDCQLTSFASSLSSLSSFLPRVDITYSKLLFFAADAVVAGGGDVY